MMTQQEQQRSPLHSILNPSVTARLQETPPEPTRLDLKHLISKRRQHENILALTVQSILTPEECQAMIERSEAIGYGQALVNMGSSGVGVRIPGYRDGQRCIIDDRAFADELWKRIEPYIPLEYEHRPRIELNERLRFLKYGPSDQFQPHMDGEYRRTDGSGHVTKVTIQFYLNDTCTGGATSFLNEREFSSDRGGAIEKLEVSPKPGQILVFQHDLVHEGSKVTEGVKYVVRSDILYGRPQRGQYQ
ncbi:hypothetical protein EMPS_01319 [Entomortierella parvispora]|uniref:Prolyl 4-hydroxylase alpha subunit domain-containing protein n=1 Tax=Entomortierella parvispora TaxID=205924 RepID=A0A9P3H2N2_9FUNG|nr:hypothetical protein EMPS_01319 [Entomortierella parvispora]